MLNEVATTISLLFTFVNTSLNGSAQPAHLQAVSYPEVPKQSSIHSTQKNHITRVQTPRQKINYLEEISKLNIDLHPGSSKATLADMRGYSSSENLSLNHCAELAYKTLKNLPEEPVSQLKDLTLHFDESLRRGLGGGSRILLRCSNVTDSEVVGVLIHEIGHIQDTGVFQGNFWAGESEFKDGENPVYNDDPSLEFYRLSFIDENTRKRSSSDLDFVSGYALTDPFEDFAESFNYYILHGEEFRELAKENSILEKKYEFLKEKVFENKEYFNGDMRNIAVADSRNYDTTILNYNLPKFFAI